MQQFKYNGSWPVAPTPFTDSGNVDLDGMKRVIDCMIDQGADGICILANFSEQFSLSDDERSTITKLCMKHVSGRVPVIVTISHFSTEIAVSRTKNALSLGAEMVMMMPPYHGTLLHASDNQIYQQFDRVGNIGIPIMLQDAPISGIDLSVEIIVKMIKEIEQLKCVKIESQKADTKIKKIIKIAQKSIDGPFGGKEGINLINELDAGASGCMSSALLPELIRSVIISYLNGNLIKAKNMFKTIFPLIEYENRHCGFRAAKVIMKEGGVIKSDYCRHPIAELHPDKRNYLLELAKNLNLVALHWGK